MSHILLGTGSAIEANGLWRESALRLDIVQALIQVGAETQAKGTRSIDASISLPLAACASPGQLETRRWLTL